MDTNTLYKMIELVVLVLILAFVFDKKEKKKLSPIIGFVIAAVIVASIVMSGENVDARDMKTISKGIAVCIIALICVVSGKRNM